MADEGTNPISPTPAGSTDGADVAEALRGFFAAHAGESVQTALWLAAALLLVLVYPITGWLHKWIGSRMQASVRDFWNAAAFAIRLLATKTIVLAAIRVLAAVLETPLPDWLNKAQGYAGFFIFIMGLWSVVDCIEQKVLSSSGGDATLSQVTGNVLKITLSFFVILAVLQLFGASLSGLLAFGGMGGLVVGMAAKDLLANIFGSIMIFMDKPFKVGDWIRSPDREIEGVVEKIGLRITSIRNFDKRPMYIPNAVFSTIVVENPSRMTYRRIYEVIGIRHEDADKVEKIIEQVQLYLAEHPFIVSDENPSAHFDTFGVSSLDMIVNAYCTHTSKIEYQRTKQEVLLEIARIITACGATCAKPESNVYLSKSLSGL